MTDPLVVACVIRRPWPQRSAADDAKPGQPRWRIRRHSAFWTLAGRGFYWPPLITIWHVEPGGRDPGEVCKQGRRIQRPDGTWESRVLRGWRWHVWHWRIQVHPFQAWRRWLLTRCEWCGGRSRTGDAVNISHQWDRKREPWWRGERGLFHTDCSAIESAHRTCLCANPIHDSELGGWTYGHCARCGKRRGWGTTESELDRMRMLAAIPAGGRDREVYEQVCALAQAERANAVAADTREEHPDDR